MHSEKSSNAPQAGVKKRIPRLVQKAQLTVQINLAARLTNQAARIRLGEIGAWPGQIPILLWLLERDGVIQKELVELLNMEQSSLAEHLDRMEKSGLLFRKQGTEDKRTYRIFLTEHARSISDEVLGELEAGAKLFMKGISNEEMQIFHSVISRVIDNLDGFIKKNTVKVRRSSKASPAASAATSRKSRVATAKPRTATSVRRSAAG